MLGFFYDVVFSTAPFKGFLLFLAGVLFGFFHGHSAAAFVNLPFFLVQLTLSSVSLTPAWPLDSLSHCSGNVC